jgi:tripartite-type tricarboxylate transporter receptor subunit TctC
MGMKIARRHFLKLGACALAFATTPRRTWAKAYPSRPVHLLVGFPPGGTGDVVARLFAQALSERLGEQFVVENRAGAASNLAVGAVVRAPADGYTLAQITVTSAVNATLYEKINFDLRRDIAMVAGTSRSPLVLEVNPAVPVTTVPEFIAYAKTRPGKISLASFGIGTISHLAGALFKQEAGIDIIHVPYRGAGPMLTDLLGGQVQAAFDVLPASIGHIQAGKLRALAVTSLTRADTLPNVPALSEFLPGFEASGWTAIGAPKSTPVEIVDRLNKEVSACFTEAKVKTRLSDLGSTPLMGSPAELDKFVAAEIEKWGKVIRSAAIKPE